MKNSFGLREEYFDRSEKYFGLSEKKIFWSEWKVFWFEWKKYFGLSEKPAGHGPDVVESATLNEDEDLKVLRPQLMSAPLKAHVPEIDDIFLGESGEKKYNENYFSIELFPIPAGAWMVTTEGTLTMFNMFVNSFQWQSCFDRTWVQPWGASRNAGKAPR